jgi:hypothetical protein
MPAVNDDERSSQDGDGESRGRVTRETLHAPFRPVRTRAVSRAAAIVEMVVVGVPALLVARSGPGRFDWADRLSIIALGAVIAAFIFRFSLLSAIPSEQGLVVHNLVRTTRLEWAQVVSVRFGGGNPWALLDLDDGETMPVMAVQRADGTLGEAEAQRLATLVALHSQTSHEG